MSQTSEYDIKPDEPHETLTLKRRDLVTLAGLSSLGLLGARGRQTMAAEQGHEEADHVVRKSLCAWDQSNDLGPAIVDITGGMSQAELHRHETFTREAITLSEQAEQHCNHPFGALLVLSPAEGEAGNEYRILLKGENRVHTDGDETQHAESRLVSDANRNDYITKDMMSRAILYTSAEPCAMCCGAIFWSGIRTVVYAAPHDAFGTSSFPVPCREVFKFAAVDQAVTVIGPVLASASIPIVDGYFRQRWSSTADDCRIVNKL